MIKRGAERVRQKTKDRNGQPLTPGTKVRIVSGDGKVEGTVVRIMDDYDVLTVLVPEGRAQAERMFRIHEVEAV